MPIHLDSIPRRYVPGRGSLVARVFVCGEAPGQAENALGWPFVGQSGDELDSYLAWGAGLDRRELYTTNLYKYWPLHDHRGKQLPPSPEQIVAGGGELRMELAIVRPRVVVAVGAHAARWFLGGRFDTMRKCHGIPQRVAICLSCGAKNDHRRSYETGTQNANVLVVDVDEERTGLWHSASEDRRQVETAASTQIHLPSASGGDSGWVTSRPHLRKSELCEAGASTTSDSPREHVACSSPQGLVLELPTYSVLNGQAQENEGQSGFGLLSRMRQGSEALSLGEAQKPAQQETQRDVCCWDYRPLWTTVLSVYHPAAGLHQDRAQVDIKWDFDQLGRLLRGEIDPSGPVDEYQEPLYERIDDDLGPDWLAGSRGADWVASILVGRTVVAIDTEGTIADPWCVTFSVRPGEAWLIRSTERESLAALDRHLNAPGGMVTVILHNAAHDLPVLAAMGIRADNQRAVNLDGSLRLRDTMSEAYLLGTEPKGLKPLAWRMAGMEMESYEELVGPIEAERSLAYIATAFDRLRCSTCHGEGKIAKRGRAWVPVPNCSRCSGSGLDPLGKSNKLLKKPRRCDCCMLSTRELVGRAPCPAGCVDGLLVPLPDREFIFDAAKGDWRYKQPQSIARWMKRRIKAGGALEDYDDPTDPTSPAETTLAAIVGTDPTVDDRDEEPAHAYFKLRRDWGELSGRADRAYVEAIAGRMPRTTLSDVPDRARVTRYACRDADATLRVAAQTEPCLAALDLLAIREMDVAFVPMLSRMEQTGLPIDRPHWIALSEHCGERMERVRARLADLLGERMNPNSEKLAEVLFERLKLPSVKLTKSGSRESIDDDTLGMLEAGLRKALGDDANVQLALGVVGCIREYREVQKFKSGYVDPVLEYAISDVLHTTLNYTSVATGRLSSSDPVNAQTFPNPDNYSDDTPRELNYGVQCRSGFIAGEGYKFIGADYAQIEMIVGAHVTQDEGLLRVFRDGLDAHYYAASLMFGYAYDPARGVNDVPKRVRTQVKPINFGAFYGIGPDRLQMQLATLPNGAVDKTVDECAALLALYYERFPGILAWKERLWEGATETGYVRDMFGRIRWVPGLRSRIRKVRSAAEREAANMPIQSGANGIIRIASRGIWERELPAMWAQGIDVQPVMQTHDENVLRCRVEYAGLVGAMVAGAMRGAVRLSVPIKVEAKIGDTLYDIK